MLFIQYPKCKTCQKAKKWLDENNIEYTDRHIKEENTRSLKAGMKKAGCRSRNFSIRAAFSINLCSLRISCLI